MRILQAKRGYEIKIGREGENNVTKVVFPLRNLFEIYGEGTLELLVQRPGETTAYVREVTVSENSAEWIVVSDDLVKPGIGYCELRLTSGDAIVKGPVYKTYIQPVLTEAEDED